MGFFYDEDSGIAEAAKSNSGQFVSIPLPGIQQVLNKYRNSVFKCKFHFFFIVCGNGFETSRSALYIYIFIQETFFKYLMSQVPCNVIRNGP